MPKSELICVYDIEAKRFVLDGVDREVVCHAYGINSHTVSQYITRGYKLKDRYVICRQSDRCKIESEQSIDSNETAYIPKREAWMDEWDYNICVAAEMLRSGNGIIVDSHQMVKYPKYVEAVK